MISNQCLLLIQHDKQHLKNVKKVLILHILDGFLHQEASFWGTSSNKLMSFSYQSERNLTFKPVCQSLLSLTVLTEITCFVWMETWRAQVSQLFEFPKSYFSHSLLKAFSVSRISSQIYVQEFWASRAQNSSQSRS